MDCISIYKPDVTGSKAAPLNRKARRAKAKREGAGPGKIQVSRLTPQAGNPVDEAGMPSGDRAALRWMGAQDLKPGMEVVTADGRTAMVMSVTPVKERQNVYNITVATDHTY
ncbi:MAG: hypothetical protein WBA35_03215, partial [Litorimonas sp.]